MTTSPLTRLGHDEAPGSRWILVLLAVIGTCQALAPFVLGHADAISGYSEIASGASIVALALVALALHKPWVAWLTAVPGMWLILAPIALWAPTPERYASSTVIGTVVTALGFVIPVTRRQRGPDVPAGWSYNPSQWSQRVPVIVLAAGSYVVALYMTAFQLGYIRNIVDPLFGDGTRTVLTSSVSQAFPVSDAGLGAAMYLIDLVMSCAGDTRRWRTMPWLVLVFGVLIIPVGVISIVLVMLQPIAVGAWCFWCLLTAIATLAMIPLAIDEVGATLQLLRRARAKGRRWQHVLWHGDHLGATLEPSAPRAIPGAFPRSLPLIAGVGLWLMVEPSALDTRGTLASSTTICGALAIVIAVCAASEIARPARFAVVPVALWTIAAPWLLAGSTPTSHFSGVLAGLLLLALSLPRGPVKQRRAELDRIAIWPAHPRRA